MPATASNGKSVPGGSGDQHPQPPSDILPFHYTLAAGSASALLSSVFMNPIDVVKTRMQASPHPSSATCTTPSQCHPSPLGPGFIVSARAPTASASAPQGASATLSAVLAEGGLRALWRGLPPSLVMAVPNVALYLTAYESLKAHGVDPFAAGGAGRLAASLVTAPLDYARTVAQAGLGGPGQRITESAVARVTRMSGGGMMRGALPTVARDVPFSAVYWGVYELMRAAYIDRAAPALSAVSSPSPSSPASQIPSSSSSSSSSSLSYSSYPPQAEDGSAANVSPGLAVSFGMGLVSGTVAAVLTTPMDVVKTRVQTSREGACGCGVEPAGTLGTTLHIARTQGVAGFFTGVGPRMLRVAPACAIMITTYEVAKSILAERMEE